MSTAVVERMSNAEYHADHSRVGHSMLEVFGRSRVEYAARFVHGTMSHPEPTPAMCLGTALHALILEPDRFDELIAVAPDVDRRTKDGKSQWSEFQSGCNGRAVINAEQNSIVTRMAKSVLAHPEAFKLLKRAEIREHPILWTNEASSIQCKCKPDLLWQVGALIGDLKTASDPTPGAWSRQAASLGYHRQNAYYRSGVESFIGRVPKFLHIVVGTSEPYECCCYFMDESAVDKGEFMNQGALNSLAQCIESGEWRATQNLEIKVVDLPKWAMYE